MTAASRQDPLRQVLPWLVLALVLHAAVLWVPLAERTARAPERALEVQLAPWRTERPAQPGPTVEPAAANPVPAAQPPPAPAATAERAPPPPVVERRPRVPMERQPWSLGPPRDTLPPRRLGDAPADGRPDAWTRPVMPVTPNLFDRAVVPRDVEIVDRWQSADGGHRVVLNSPDGNTYCGRANGYDPFHPEMEPIMTWHRCAGGGARTGRKKALDFRATP